LGRFVLKTPGIPGRTPGQVKDWGTPEPGQREFNGTWFRP
jgi:hypothetical protein